MPSVHGEPCRKKKKKEEEFYMLQPANKSDRMCHLVAMTMRSSCSGSTLHTSNKHMRRVMIQMCVRDLERKEKSTP